MFIEVKGVTLEKNNIAMFPDAPTVRGLKHLTELKKCMADGYEACVVFVIQMDGISYFVPNRKIDPEFCSALADVKNAGVNVLAFDCVVTEDSMVINNQIQTKI